MSDVYEGPGWTKASDGKWYPPGQEPTSAGGQEMPDEARPDSQLPTGQDAGALNPKAPSDSSAADQNDPLGGALDGLDGTSSDKNVEPMDKAVLSRPDAIPPMPLVADNAAVPAAWYPDPIDSASFRYWDGAAWTRLTRLVPPPTMPIAEAPTGPSEAGAAHLDPDVAPSETSDTYAQTEGTERKTNDVSAGHEEPVDQWVREADKLVAIAWAVGTPDAWRSAARAAVVVAEIAQTMRVITHAHQIAEHTTRAAEEAVDQARTAQATIDDAMRRAEHMAQAAEEAARAARVAADIAADARQKAEKTAQATPQVLESAQIAAQAAAKAKARAGHLDQIVIKAGETNTPEGWSEALQIAVEASGFEDRLPVVSTRPVSMAEPFEGWYTDPYALHEARWMSDGIPTPLVRDGTVEGHDPAPDEPFKVTPVRLGDDAKPNDAADLRRADDAERGPTYDPQKAARGAWDAYDQSDAQG